MKPRSPLLLTIVAAALTACGQSESRTADESVADDIARQTGPTASADIDPCTILDDALIHRHFALGDAEITRTASTYSPHPLCTVSWPKPNATEIEARLADQMVDFMTRRMRGEDVEMPSLRTSDEVSLTIGTGVFANRRQALDAFDGAMRVMTEGMTVETSAGPIDSPRYDVEPVAGVGEKAMWAPGLHQLSVVTTERIFHVGVRIDGGLAEELEKAKALAREIAAAL
jgi:hypothetical protein